MLDQEWVKLMKEAQQLGLSKEDVRLFFQKRNVSSLIERNQLSKAPIHRSEEVYAQSLSFCDFQETI
ncbi:hypothetical protein J2Z40_002642 [Cytobacillus eiseniae]|uniref:Sin domain-containing protein n=1 Tax=Cytobacillus eiseniae TaxID=762947 RepID=A0ABS4RIF1_9BACI|nr:hypothetical protein [Cytobacillus eiseniae]